MKYSSTKLSLNNIGLNLNWKTVLIISFSIILKGIFFYLYNVNLHGIDALEYIDAASVFEKSGLGYIFNNSPATFWRMPVYPFIIYLLKTQLALYLFQMGLTYLMAYYIYLIFIRLDFTLKTSLAVALFSLFVPYINISACGTGPEMLQVMFFVYLTKKILYGQRDIKIGLVLALYVLLRPEGFLIVTFLIIRDLFLKKIRTIALYVIPLTMIFLWQFRNLQLFQCFTLVNPIHSSRAMIGSIYGFIYISPPHPFHSKYNYYEGKDYINNLDFVEKYKNIVKKELTNYILKEPIKYLMHRIYWILKSFSYVSFYSEKLPDKNWNISRSTNIEEIVAINSNWAYDKLLMSKDYLRLLLRIIYNGSFVFGHIFGLIYILIHVNRFKILIFVFACFSYIFLVEVDMRYLLFSQLMCLCITFAVVINNIKSIISKQIEYPLNIQIGK